MVKIKTPFKSLLKARFITFEGGEGVGKSTQVRLLKEKLEKLDINVIATREPGGTKKAEAIRSFILEGKSENWGPEAEAILFASARLDHMNELIAPNLKKGNWVISDRFHDSTRAYQGLTSGVKENLIATLEELALNGHSPDITILLDMDPKIAFERVAMRDARAGLTGQSDRFEKEDLGWHSSLRNGFLKIAKNNAKRFVIIDANANEDEIAKAVWKAVSKKFPLQTKVKF